jgi:hypothetical protein
MSLRKETDRFTVMETERFPILVEAVMTALKALTSSQRWRPGIGMALVEELYAKPAK